MNGEICCIIGACCPLEKQIEALAAWYVEQGIPPTIAKQVAANLLTHVDLVPKGSVNIKKMIAAGSHK
jgi:hypothetical protein